MDQTPDENPDENADDTLTQAARGQREGRWRMSVAHLLAALVALFAVQPLVDRLPYGDWLESIAFTFVLFAGVNAVGGRRRTHAIAALLVAPALLTRWIDHFWQGSVPDYLSQVASMLFVAFIAAHLLRFVVVAPRVNAEVLYAALAAFLLVAIVWSLLYTMLWQADPAAFKLPITPDGAARLEGFLAVYYSLQIITANTYGDITPVSNAARVLTLSEAIVGLFYLAILISRLVGAYSSERARVDKAG